MSNLTSSQIDFQKLFISTHGNISSDTIFISHISGDSFELSEILDDFQDECETKLDLILNGDGYYTDEEIQKEAQKIIDHALDNFTPASDL